MQISNVFHAEIFRTMEGNLLIRYTVEQPGLNINGKPASQALSINLNGTMDVSFHDLRPWMKERPFAHDPL